MKIKTKLNLGIGVLFFLIILLSVVGVVNINALKQDTKNILTANYKSLLYCQNMSASMQKSTIADIDKFEINLKQQLLNATEIGESELTKELTINFKRWKENQNNIVVIDATRNCLFQIMNLNMQAIQRKSQIADKTADTAMLWIAISVALCFLIAIILLINLPANIANPIKELAASIKQIAEKNYSERLHFDSNSEFGQVSKSFNTMAEKLEQYNSSNVARLMMEKERIETLINKMYDPVIGIDENLNIIFANDEANHILGLKDSELIGFQSKDLALKNDLLRELIRDICNPENEKAPYKPLKIFVNGKESYFEKDIQNLMITPTGETESKLIGYVILLRNVTEYKELDSAKTNFIATVSHEFKTPISSIKMSLQLLGNEQVGKLNKEQKNLLESINEDANRLLKTTTELLNVTQVESGNIQLSILPTNIREVVEYAIRTSKNQAEHKQIKLQLECPDDLPIVLADYEKTTWVITNLISNAIRYSYEDSIIHVSITENSEEIIISVKDQGQGIAPQYIPKIFDRYFRVPGTKKEGTGLGLAISKEFIEAQGGTITVLSEYGSGSTFSLNLKKTV